MLMIALIVLVAMTLAGIATMRSVDTGSIVAGNIAFKESAVHAADQGIQAAVTWLGANSTQLNNDNNAQGVSSVGYFSSTAELEPDWADKSTWSNAAAINGGLADVSGNVVYYMIQRLCPIQNCAPGATCGGQSNTCGQTPSTAIATGEGVDLSRPNPFKSPPAIHYRVTARSVGPRNSITIVQTHLRLVQ
jgi:Tfp pilus assembly protein PilX